MLLNLVCPKIELSLDLYISRHRYGHVKCRRVNIGVRIFIQVAANLEGLKGFNR